MVYRFRNSVCPLCNLPVSCYSYKLDKYGRKIHIDCEEVV